MTINGHRTLNEKPELKKLRKERLDAVTSQSAGTPYLLSVYAHPEVTPVLANPFTPVETQNAANTGTVPAGNSDDNNILLYAVIGLLVVVIVLLAALVFKKQGAAVILLGLCSASLLSITPSSVMEEPNLQCFYLLASVTLPTSPQARSSPSSQERV